jgi:hypothetical protein
MLCEKSEWSAVLVNQGTTETLGLSCGCGGGRRLKKRRPGEGITVGMVKPEEVSGE